MEWHSQELWIRFQWSKHQFQHSPWVPYQVNASLWAQVSPPIKWGTGPRGDVSSLPAHPTLNPCLEKPQISMQACVILKHQSLGQLEVLGWGAHLSEFIFPTQVSGGIEETRCLRMLIYGFSQWKIPWASTIPTCGDVNTQPGSRKTPEPNYSTEHFPSSSALSHPSAGTGCCLPDSSFSTN